MSTKETIEFLVTFIDKEVKKVLFKNVRQMVGKFISLL